MSAVLILNALLDAGVDVRLEKNGTALSVPKGRLSSEQRQMILSNRDLLIEHLRRIPERHVAPETAPSSASCLATWHSAHPFHGQKPSVNGGTGEKRGNAGFCGNDFCDFGANTRACARVRNRLR